MTAKRNRLETISDLAMGKPQTAANLIMVPLSGNPVAALDYLLVDEALCFEGDLIHFSAFGK